MAVWRDSLLTTMVVGGSPQALRLLADDRGYVLLGSNRAGFNAFFIRKDLAPALKLGDDISEAIRTPEVTAAASRVSVHPEVREAMAVKIVDQPAPRRMRLHPAQESEELGGRFLAGLEADGDVLLRSVGAHFIDGALTVSDVDDSSLESAQARISSGFGSPTVGSA